MNGTPLRPSGVRRRESLKSYPGSITSVDETLNLPVIDIYRPGVSRRSIRDTLSHAYWRLAPSIHRRRRHAWSGSVDPLVDPFVLVLVDPTRIVLLIEETAITTDTIETVDGGTGSGSAR